MGVSLITAVVIATNPMVIEAVGPDSDGKFSGTIRRDEAKYRRPLVTSEPVFDSAEDANASMEQVVDDCRKAINSRLQ